MEPANESPSVSEVAARLGQVWVFYHRGMKGHKLLSAASEVCDQLLEDGLSEVDIESEIKRKGRDRTEPYWEFVKRMRGKLQPGVPVLPDGEIEVQLEEWIKFVSAYIAEWPWFGGDYSFLNDWRASQPFMDATLNELLGAIRAVRANPEASKHTNKFSLLAAAIRSARKSAKALERRPDTKPEPWVDDGRPDSECTAGMLAARHGALKTMEILQERKKVKP